jgi:hypothetical protein
MTPRYAPRDVGGVAACGCFTFAFGLGVLVGLVLAAILR